MSGAPLSGTASRPAARFPAGLNIAELIAGQPDWTIASCLSLIATLPMVPYLQRAQFLYDDWVAVAAGTFHIRQYPSIRPLASFLTTAQVAVFGTQPRPYYTWTVGLFVASVALLYCALRSLGLPRLSAILATAFFIALPNADSLRLWWAAGSASLAIVLALLGVISGVRWTTKPTWRSLLVSELTFAAAALTYQTGPLLFLLPICLLGFSTRRTRFLVKGAIDIAVIAAANILPVLIFLGTPSSAIPVRALSQYPDRLVFLARTGFTAFVLRRFELDRLEVGAAVGVALVVFAAMAAFQRRRTIETAEAAPGSLLAVALMAVALIGATFVGWIPLTPVNDWYSPALLGVGNRVNGVSVVFFAVALGALGGHICSYYRSRHLWTVPTVAVGAAMSVMLLVSAAEQSLADVQSWGIAAERRTSALHAISRAVPKATPHLTFVLADYTIYSGRAWVPVLSAPWDSSAAVQLLYDDPSLSAMTFGSTLKCGAYDLYGAGNYLPYSQIAVVDIQTGTLISLANREDCQSQLARLIVREWTQPDA